MRATPGRLVTGYRKKRWLAFAMLTMSTATLLSTGLTADPFASYPGTRAQGIAGATTALEDMASVWSNPAGVALSKEGGVLEWKQSSTLNSIDDSLGSTSTLFVGFQQSLDIWTVGLYYFQPYTMEYGVDYATDGGRVSGKVSNSYQSLSVPIAVSGMDGKVKLGVTLDWVVMDASGSALNSTLNSDNPKNPGTPLLIEANKPGGFAYSAGALVEVLDHQPWDMKVNLGAVYRSQSGDDPANVDGNTLTKAMIFGKPGSVALAASMSKHFNGGNVFRGAVQIDNTRWSSARSYSKFSLGAELEQPLEGRYDLTMFYRVGWYSASAKEEGTSLDWPDSSGLTGGFGIQSEAKYQLDISVEQQKIEHRLRNDDANILLGLSLSIFI